MDADEDSDPKLDMKPHMIAKCTCAHLILNVLMDSAFWLDTLNLDCSIIYIEGSRVILSKYKCKSFNEDFFVLANSIHADEMAYIYVFIVCQNTSTLYVLYNNEFTHLR